MKPIIDRSDDRIRLLLELKEQINVLIECMIESEKEERTRKISRIKENDVLEKDEM